MTTTPPVRDAAPPTAAEQPVPEAQRTTPRDAFRAVHCGDGLVRCPWALGSAGALADHDTDWGTPPADAHEHFAALTLELVDSGLARWSQSARHGSWYLHMAELRPERLALFDDDDVEDLLVNAELIRNRAKIEAVIHNARVCRQWDVPQWLRVFEEAEVPPTAEPPGNALDLPDSTAASRRLSQVLRSRGIVLVGPVSAQRWLQRIGRAPGHVAGCHRLPAAAPA
ncbi:DNA-3-methyladenine glycosylase I [Kocuria tytonis]|uniref:DNA-3-methyladenine glycosylase I n=1 Tax=Kocuria tytonis TaxID=2054280 RepID=A0A495A6R8_9MICC|nr:DNA-3-methyladenine glycosylase I [Kocuria tytonis]RKQ34876.1 DNA-3-methyladenine glycosylase I [Kocuria tytonis]